MSLHCGRAPELPSEIAIFALDHGDRSAQLKDEIQNHGINVLIPEQTRRTVSGAGWATSEPRAFSHAVVSNARSRLPGSEIAYRGQRFEAT